MGKVASLGINNFLFINQRDAIESFEELDWNWISRISCKDCLSAAWGWALVAFRIVLWFCLFFSHILFFFLLFCVKPVLHCLAINFHSFITLWLEKARMSFSSCHIRKLAQLNCCNSLVSLLASAWTRSSKIEKSHSIFDGSWGRLQWRIYLFTGLWARCDWIYCDNFGHLTTGVSM